LHKSKALVLAERNSKGKIQMPVTFAPPVHPFYGATQGATLAGADIALFGAPHGSPYPGFDNSPFADTPDTLRAALQPEADWTDHWDYDLGGPLLGERDVTVADLGNLGTTSLDGPGNRALIRAATEEIVAAGAVPVLLGGDDSVPIPFFEGLAARGPLTILQIDAHIDWRDERRGVTHGFSSTMRRASEMAHVERIVQAGMRGLGSARRAEVEFAAEWGAEIFTAQRVHAEGIGPVLDAIPSGASVVITLDVDALDASIMPACVAPTAGGLSYTQTIQLIAGAARRGRLVGFDLIEFVPERDVSGIAAQTAARLVVNAIGALARSV
jgi:agmatinase